MRLYIFYVIFCIIILIEGIITTMPLVLSLLIAYAVSVRRDDVFLLAFVSGIMLDLTQGRMVGETSLFLLCSVYLVLMYKRKYEIASYPFVFLSSLFLSYIYLYIFIHNDIYVQVAASTIVSLVSFSVLRNYFAPISKSTQDLV